MRPLFIGAQERASVRGLVVYAAEPKRWYRPEQAKVPGNDPAFCLHLWTYRCVFSFSVIDGDLLRHLSISVPSTGMPSPIAAFTLAELFGFTGWTGSYETPKDWQIYANHEEHCIVLGQPIVENIDIDLASFDSRILHVTTTSESNA
jgi:hypothetical protein